MNKKQIRPRSKDGVFFGDFDKKIKEAVKKINKRYPDFFTEKYSFSMKNRNNKHFIDHPVYKEIRDKIGNAEAATLQSILFHEIGYKKYKTVFVEDEGVIDFIKNNKITGKDEDALIFAINNELPKLVDYRDQPISLSIASMKNNIFFKVFLYDDHGQLMIGAISGTSISRIKIGKAFLESIDHDEDRKYENILLNTILYIAANPECLRDGPPENFIKCQGFESRQKTILCSNQLLDLSRNVSPHLRRGHFRLLSSEKFRNKKGKLVFVRPSMVKGKSLTVEGCR